MRSINPVLVLTFLSTSAFFFMSSNSGSPGGRTGSPTDGKTCGTNGCHGQQAGNPEDMLEVDASSGYDLDSTYGVTITANETGITKYGFELVAEDTNGVKQGTFIGNSQVTSYISNQRATHKSSSTSASSGTKTWTVDWKAPSSNAGPLTFYLAVLAADGGGTNSGDEVLIDNQEVQSRATVSISENQIIALELFQDPMGKFIKVKGAAQGTQFQLFGMGGKKHPAEVQGNRISTAQLASGMYLLHAEGQDGVWIGKFVKP